MKEPSIIWRHGPCLLILFKNKNMYVDIFQHFGFCCDDCFPTFHPPTGVADISFFLARPFVNLLMQLIEQRHTTDTDDLDRLAKDWSALFQPGDIILLNGPLGSGKTTLVQHLCQHWEVREAVTSPTFTLMQHYTGRFPVVHMDLYRLESDLDLHELGWEEWLNGDTIGFVEWPQRLEPFLTSYYSIHIKRDNEKRLYELYRGGRP